MTASVSSPADVVNLALTRIGFKDRVNSLYDGSKAAKQTLDIYSQTRDALLRENDWGFAERNVLLTLLKSAPIGGYIPPTTWSTTYPPLPWQYEYQWPSDCLKVRAIKGVPLFLPDVDPQPVIFGLENDNSYTPTKKVILCNVPTPAVLVYTGQVTDPTTWEADFVEALAAELGRRLAPVLVGGNAVQIAAADAANSKAIAEREQG